MNLESGWNAPRKSHLRLWRRGRRSTIGKPSASFVEIVDNVRSYSFGNDVIVELSGEHDMSTIPRVEPAIAAAFTDRAMTIFDLTHVTYVDSSVLSMLLRAHKRLGERMRLVVADDTRVRRVFEITQIDRYIATFATLAAALQPTI